MNSCRQTHPRAWRSLQVSRCAWTRNCKHLIASKRYLTVTQCSGSESDGSVDPIHLHREKELSRREDRLWQRMELLLDREAELREQETSSANRREAHLQSQVDMLLSILSNSQPDKSLPPAATGKSNRDPGPPPPRIADVLQTIQQSAANQSRGTFAEYNDDNGTIKTIDQVIREGPGGVQHDAAPHSIDSRNGQAAPAGQPSFAEEIQGVVNDVLHGRTDPLDSIEWSDLRVPQRKGSAGAPQTPPAATGSPPGSPAAPQTPSPASARGGAAPMSISDAMVAAAAAAAEAGEGPVETEKAPKDGPPPLLNTGDDDIYWVAALQTALLKNGCYCGEDDEADFFFGGGTQAAVLTFQAMQKLSETGIADPETWAALGIHSGADVAGDGAAAPETDPAENGIIWQQGDTVSDGTASPKNDPAEDGFIWQQGDKLDGGGSFGGLFAGLGVGGQAGRGGDDGNGAPAAAATGADEGRALAAEGQPRAIQSAQRRETPQYTEWPILREGDGERAVHTLHVMLQQQGFHPEEEDTKWWMFGSSTVSALSTFQACSSLPDTGVCDVTTWHALMGDSATPESIDLVFSGDSDDEDMEQIADGRVYLLGEQRWSKY